jgi:sigma-E factor negative regulatory protein RseC
MANIITHQGIVESIENTRMTVRITQTSACAACSARGHCASADTQDKLIDVYIPPHAAYRPGDSVTIVGKLSMGMKAVFLAFVMPFVLLIVSLFVFMALTDNDQLLSGLLALAVLIPYYVILWLMKGRLSRSFMFTVENK